MRDKFKKILVITSIVLLLIVSILIPPQNNNDVHAAAPAVPIFGAIGEALGIGAGAAAGGGSILDSWSKTWDATKVQFDAYKSIFKDITGIGANGAVTIDTGDMIAEQKEMISGSLANIYDVQRINGIHSDSLLAEPILIDGADAYTYSKGITKVEYRDLTSYSYRFILDPNYLVLINTYNLDARHNTNIHGFHAILDAKYISFNYANSNLNLTVGPSKIGFENYVFNKISNYHNLGLYGTNSFTVYLGSATENIDSGSYIDSTTIRSLRNLQNIDAFIAGLNGLGVTLSLIHVDDASILIDNHLKDVSTRDDVIAKLLEGGLTIPQEVILYHNPGLTWDGSNYLTSAGTVAEPGDINIPRPEVKENEKGVMIPGLPVGDWFYDMVTGNKITNTGTGEGDGSGTDTGTGEGSDGILSFLTDILSQILNAIKALPSAIASAFSYLFDGVVTILTTISGYLADILGLINSGIATLVNAISTGFSNISNIVTNIFNSIELHFENVISTISSFPLQFANSVKEALIDAFPSMSGVIGAINGIPTAVNDVIGSIINGIGATIESAFDVIIPGINLVNTGISNLIEGVGALPGSIVGGISTSIEAIGSAVGAIGNTISNVTNFALNGILSILESILLVLQSILSFLNNLIANLINALTEMLKLLFIPTTALTSILSLVDVMMLKFPFISQIKAFFGAFTGGACTDLKDIKITVFGITATVFTYEFLSTASVWIKPIIASFIWLLVFRQAYYKVITMISGKGGTKG